MIGRWLLRTWGFANWTWSTPEEAARTRAGWPPWRRSIRPIGAAAWLIATTIGAFMPNGRNPAGFGLGLVAFGVAAGCVLFGIVDGYRSRRANRRTGRVPSG
jgi:peptidoglycan/LPS O-acetylase OafA/YrhL